MAKKKVRELIKFVSTGVNEKGKKTGFIKMSTKNKRLMKDKLKKRCYDPRAIDPETGKRGIHVVFEETKV